MFKKIKSWLGDGFGPYHYVISLADDFLQVVLVISGHYFAEHGQPVTAGFFVFLWIAVAVGDLAFKGLREKRERRLVYNSSIEKVLESAALSLLRAMSIRPPKDHIRANIMVPAEGGLRTVFRCGYDAADLDADITVPIGTGCAGQAWLKKQCLAADLTLRPQDGTPPNWGLPDDLASKVRPSLQSILAIPVKDSETAAPIAILGFDSDNTVKQMEFSELEIQKIGYSFAATIANFLRTTGVANSATGISWIAHFLNGLRHDRRKLAFVATFVIVAFVGVSVLIWSTFHSRIRSLAVVTLNSRVSDGRLGSTGRQISDMVIDSISEFPELRVLPGSLVPEPRLRQPSSAGRLWNPKAVADELDVEALLTIEVNSDGDGFAVHFDLIKAADETVMSAGEERAGAAEFYKLSEDIPRRIVEQVVFKLTGEKQYVPTKHTTPSSEAYHEYILGTYFWNRRSENALNSAVERFNKSVEKDPRFALAHAALANCYNLLAIYSTKTPPAESFKRAMSQAEQAKNLDDGLPEAHAALAFAKYRYEWDFVGARAEFGKSIRLNPQYATARHWYGEYLVPMGDPTEAVKQMRLAADLDPSSLIINADLGATLLFNHEVDAAIEQLKRTLEMDHCFAYAHALLAQAYEVKGMYDAALNEYQLQAHHSDDPSAVDFSFARLQALSGDPEKAKEMLEQLLTRNQQPYAIASIYEALGNTEKAFNWLESAYAERSERLIWLNVDPTMASLRSDSRFKDLVRRIECRSAGCDD